MDGIDLVIHADPPSEHKGLPAPVRADPPRARAGKLMITLQTQAQASDVRTLMRKAGVVPLTAAVTPGSALLRSIAGERVAPVTLPVARPPAVLAAPATGRGAAAMSSGFRGRRR